MVWAVCTPNLRQRSLLSDFSHVLARAAVAEPLKAPVMKSLDLALSTNILLNLAYYFFLITTKSFIIFFV